jgi:general stress protein 26
MSKVKKTEEHPEEQLWRELKHVNAGMIGIQGSHSHMQPMAHMCDQDGAKLWFFTGRSGDFFKEAGSGSRAHFCLVGKKHDYHACLSGELRESRDRSKIDEFWNDMAAAWWKGKDDPDLALLEFDLEDAAIWASTRNPIKFAWEIQRAKSSDHGPDIGARAHVDFTEPEGSPTREMTGKRI